MNSTTITNETRVYAVAGMSCSHCVASVREEVSELDGVQRVDVDLDSARLVVSGQGFSDDAVQAAVEAAGYELAG